MASPATNFSEPRPGPCRYFVNGSCRDGVRCRFSHDRSVENSSPRFCRYFLRGTCNYGEFCRYEHARPLNQNQSSATAGSANAVSRRAQDKSEVDAEHSKHVDLLKRTKLRPEAKEFIPSYLGNNSGSSAELAADVAKDILCPYHILGQCWYGDQCSFTHGTMCDLCDRHVLHPNDPEANKNHREECLAEHERDMQTAFAIARGQDKQCGICMEVVLEKTNISGRRFGILPSCKHCFCLDCIRKWRQAKQFENKIIRACPECRTVSDFVAPSAVWVEEEQEKRSLIEAYKTAMKEKTCKYYSEGKSECPFGNKCFYRHVKPDGTVVQGDSPRTMRRRQRQRQWREGGARQGGRNGEAADLYVLWDFPDDDDWHGNLLSSDDWPWEFQLEEDFDWLSLTDSESDYYDY